VPAERPGEYLTQGKAGVLANIQKKYDIPPDKTITFGDSESDIHMFLRSGASYAINKANDITRSAAVYYAPDLISLKEQLVKLFEPIGESDEGSIPGFEGSSMF
jgi:phosphoserine phosphatase